MKEFVKPKVGPCWLDFIPHEQLEDVRNDITRLLQPQLYRNFLSLIPLQEIRDPNGQELLKVYDAVYNSSCAMLRNCYNLKYYIDRLMEPVRPSPAFPIDMSGGLSQFYEEVRPYVTSEDSALDVQIEPGIGAVCSFNLLQIALLNLLSNSMLCNQRKQTITIRLTSQGEYAEIAVIDEGIGMSPFALGRAFNMMIGAPVMMTACNSEPMGIGLPLALKCVEYDGGSIAIRSTPETGTEVRLRYLKRAVGFPVSDWFDSVRYDNLSDIPVLLSSACNVSAVLRTLRQRS